MSDPDNAFIARRLREIQNENREHVHILRAEIERVREAIERTDRRMASLEGTLFDEIDTGEAT